MNEKILIVDDEPDSLEILDAILTREKYQVLSASGGDEAIDLFKSEPIDLVITDMQMPGMDGMEVLEKVTERIGNLNVYSGLEGVMNDLVKSPLSK